MVIGSEVNRQEMTKFCKVMLRCFTCTSACTITLIGVALFVLTIFIAHVGSLFPLCYEIAFGTGSPVLVDLPTAVCSDVQIDLPGSLTLTCRDLNYSGLYRVCVDKKYSVASPQCLTLKYNEIICTPQDHESCLPASYTYKSGQSLMLGMSIFNSTSNSSFYFVMNTESGEYYGRLLTESSTLSNVWYSVLDCQTAVNLLLAWFSLSAIFFFLVTYSCCMCCCRRYCCKSEKRFPTEDDKTGILLGQRKRMWQDPSVEDFQDSQEKEGFQSEDDSEGHNTETTHWLDPRLSRVLKHEAQECEDDELPYGWEQVIDPVYGVYYVNHITRTTQYENPVNQMKRLAAGQMFVQQQLHSNVAIEDDWGQSSGVPPESGEPFTHQEVHLFRQVNGFGFRIIGVHEEDCQATIGAIVPGGAAHLDGRLQVGDKITAINNHNVMNSTHREVIELMGESAAQGEVTLRIRRKVLPADSSFLTNTTMSNNSYTQQNPPQPTSVPQTRPPPRGEREVVIERPTRDQSFGFVLQSNLHKKGCSISRLVPGSPAAISGQLFSEDMLLGVNYQDVSNMEHSDVVSLIKNSALTIRLLVKQPDSSNRQDFSNEEGGMQTAVAVPLEPANESSRFNSYTQESGRLDSSIPPPTPPRNYAEDEVPMTSDKLDDFEDEINSGVRNTPDPRSPSASSSANMKYYQDYMESLRQQKGEQD